MARDQRRDAVMGTMDRSASGQTTRPLINLAIGASTIVLVGWALGSAIVASPVATFDRALTRDVVAWRDPELTSVMRMTTWLGGVVFVSVVLAISAAVVFAVTRLRRWPAFLAGCLAGTVGLDNLIKALVDRPRPNIERITGVSGSAFPSGHSSAAAGMFLALAFVVTRRMRRGRAWVWGIAAALAIAVAVSRVYLGAHWPTDVVAGLGLGGYWTALMAKATEAWPPREGGEAAG